MKATIRKQVGLSLVELMISITLGLILMTGVVQMFLSSKESFTSQQSISRIQETGRLAIEFMTRDIRHAGTFGCMRGNTGDPVMQLQNPNQNFGGLHTNFNEGIRGYNTVAGVPAAAAALGTAAANPNENILVIRSAQDLGLGIAQATTPNDIVVEPNGAAINNNCIAGICVGQAAVVTDCYNGTVINVAGLAPNGALVSVNHANAWEVAARVNYQTGFVAPLTTAVYFIANSPNLAPGRTSLFKRTNLTPPEEVLEGVERMSITYSIGLGPYQGAQAIAVNDWVNVTSVRLELVVRSLENFAVSEPTPYRYQGVDIDPAVQPALNLGAGVPDRYARQVFSTTIDIRSR